MLRQGPHSRAVSNVRSKTLDIRKHTGTVFALRRGPHARTEILCETLDLRL